MFGVISPPRDLLPLIITIIIIIIIIIFFLNGIITLGISTIFLNHCHKHKVVLTTFRQPISVPSSGKKGKDSEHRRLQPL